MEHFNYKKDYKHLFSPSAQEPEIVQVPPLKYIMIDGQGNPEKKIEFREKLQLIYGLSNTIKIMMLMDKEAPYDFILAPYSCLWWADDMMAFAYPPRKDEWKWRIMMMQPEPVDTAILERAKQEFTLETNSPHIHQVRLETYEEDTCAQIMHIGPYDQEGAAIAKVHRFFYERGYALNGYHHEIYLGDPLGNRPGRSKSIIRQPIKKIIT
ncbi:MAG: GyrI-like domain-containing protein [Candidatus Aminicenantes bacterium]|nr:GyrI-like domain-containing protein [Candidatus Aminicenantes bacterium]